MSPITSVLLRDIVPLRVVVWGAGLEAQGALRRLLEAGARDVTVAVDRPGKNAEHLDQVRAMGVPLVVGPDAERALLEAGFVLASPSIPPANPMWERLGPHDTTSNAWMAEFGSRTLAITGSKGKSTTTHLLGHLMRQLDDRTVVGGNIGVPFFDLDPAAPLFVVEVGCQQSARMTHSPRGGAITALFPEHLDFFGTVEAYYASKVNLFAHGSQFAVTTPDVLPTVEAIDWRVPWSTVPDEGVGHDPVLGLRIGSTHVDGLPDALRARHNVSNVMVALGVAAAHGVDLEDPLVADALRSWTGLDHRLQTISMARGMRWIDDSLATAPQPTAAALEVHRGERILLVVGGQDRGVDYEPLAHAVHAHGSVVVLTVPDNGPRIGEVIRSVASSVEVHDCVDIVDAVTRAAALGQEGDVVLFSPAAPSDAGHVDYRARARAFADTIARLD